jgi:RimJ/RimL family protein N-acetyltransferase
LRVTTLQTPRGPVAVRRLTETDLAAYRDLRLEALRLAPTAFGEDYREALERSGSAWLERLRRQVTDTHSVIFCATAAGAMVGMAGVYRAHGPKLRHTGTLWGAYVRPSWRGQGVATALLESSLGWARERGLARLETRVETSAPAARRLLERSGFREAGVLRGTMVVDGRVLDEAVLELHLA